MRADLSERLKTKGWTDKEIKKVRRVLNEAQSKRLEKAIFFENLIFWFVLIIAIFGNLIVSIALIPFLLELDSLLLYSVITLLALAFGSLFDLLIRDIEAIGRKHIVVTGILIPSLAIINIFYVTQFANFFSDKWNLGISHNPWIIAILYVGAFSLPHIISYLFVKDISY